MAKYNEMCENFTLPMIPLTGSVFAFPNISITVDISDSIFKNAIDNDVWSVMVGHYGFPAIDDEKLNGQYIPATFSHKIITGLLREELGFEGVIVTDAITMGALSTMCSEEEPFRWQR